MNRKQMLKFLLLSSDTGGTLEGVPPLTFDDEGNRLINYTIYNVACSPSDNLIDDIDKWFMNSGISSYGEFQPNKENLMASDYTTVSANTSYKFGCTNKLISSANEWHRVAFYNSNKENISCKDINSFGTAFTTPSNTQYVRICLAPWYRPFLCVTPKYHSYIPSGYKVGLTVNNNNVLAFVPISNCKEIIFNDALSVPSVTFGNGTLVDAVTGSSPTKFTVLTQSDNHYVSYGCVDHATQEYIVGQYGAITDLLDNGTYTICLTVHNPPNNDDWLISVFWSTGLEPWKVVRCSSSNVVDGVAVNSQRIVVSDDETSKLSYIILRYDSYNPPEWYNNTTVDIRIVRGSKPVYAKRFVIDNANTTIPINTLPVFKTVSGENIFDVDTSPKPDKVQLTFSK